MSLAVRSETLSEHVNRMGRAYSLGAGGRAGTLLHVVCVKSIPGRDDTLDQGLLAMLERKIATGEELGRVTMVCLLRRLVLSVLSAVDIFIDQTGNVRQRLWPSVL